MVAASTSAQLYGVISDETGSGSGSPLAVFNVNPTLTGITLAGDITSTTPAIDWDLKDGDASALSFDAAGKAGILNIITTDSNEGVSLSGFLSLGADPADATTAANILMSNATSILFEADTAGTDVNALSVDSSEVVQIGSAGASGVTITPATTITGILTMSANPRIYDGDSHYLTIDAQDLSGAATLVLGGNTNTLYAANGTAVLTMTKSLTVQTGDVTITGNAAGSSITLPTAGTMLANALTSAYVFVGNGSNVATGVAISGDVTIANTGAVSIGADKIKDTMIDWGTSTGQVSLDDVTPGSTYVPVAAADVTADYHVSRVYDSDNVGYITITGLSQARVITLVDAAQTLVNLASNQTFTGTNTFEGATSFGDADTAGSIKIFDGSSNYLTVSAPSLAGDTIAFTLPSTNGTNGQVLITNGSGVTSWGDAATGDVSGAGDCASGACFDGTSDGGTYLSFYDAQGETQLIVGNNTGAVVLTMPIQTGTLMITGGTGNGDGLIFGDTYPPDAAGEIGYSTGVFQIHDGTAARTMAFLETAQSFSAAKTFTDGTTLIFGTSSDWAVSYDETTNDQLIFTTAATAAAATATPMFLVRADSGASGMTADQVIFGIKKGTTTLFTVDEDGDLYYAGSVTGAAQDDPYVLLNTTTEGDTDWYIGQDADQGGDDDDRLEFRKSATVATSVEAYLTAAGNFWIAGDLTIAGNDLTMATNTIGAVLVGDGTNFNPVVMGGHGSIAANGALTVTNFDLTGTENQGDIAYYNGSEWAVLDVGTSGQFLKTQGAAANPTWADVVATASGSTSWVQYNSSGSLGAEAAFTYTAATNTLLAGDILVVGVTNPADAGTIRLESGASIVFEDTAEVNLTHVPGTGLSTNLGFTSIGSMVVGPATPDDVRPTFSIRGDADSDAGGDTTEALTITLTPNANPVLATWGFTSTQSAGYTFDKAVAISGILSSTSLDMSASTSSIPWKVGSDTASNTAEGTVYWESDTDMLTIGDGATGISLNLTAGVVYTYPSTTSTLAKLAGNTFTANQTVQATLSNDLFDSLLTMNNTGTATAAAVYGSNTSSTQATSGTTTMYGLETSVSKGGQADTANMVMRGVSSVVSYLPAGGMGANTADVYGGYFYAGGDTSGTSTAYGIYATANGADTNYAGYFDGSVLITNGNAVKGNLTSGNTWKLQVYDNDTGPAYVDAIIFTNGNSPTITFGTGLITSAALATGLSDEQGTGVVTFSDSPTFVDDITIAAAGVKLTGADGALTILGLGNGNDEDLKIDLDNGAANTIEISSPASSATTIITPLALKSSSYITGLMPPVIVLVPSGVHDGDNDAAIMTDAGIDIGANALIGMTVYNVTDASSCTITANAATTITCTLAGGTDNNWDTNDVWQVGPGPYQSGSWFYVTAAGTIRHPATAGYAVCYESDAAAAIIVEMASDSMIFQGTLDAAVVALDAGDSIDSSGSTTGDFMCIHNKSATEAQGKGKRGTWVDGGAT